MPDDDTPEDERDMAAAAASSRPSEGPAVQSEEALQRRIDYLASAIDHLCAKRGSAPNPIDLEMEIDRLMDALRQARKLLADFKAKRPPDGS